MIIPKYLQRKGMSQEEMKRLEAFVASRRKRMESAPTFDTEAAATQAAVKLYRKDELTLPSVWKEPADIGTKHAVVEIDNREDALISGYEEEVDQQEIVDKAKTVRKADIDEIEEV